MIMRLNNRFSGNKQEGFETVVKSCRIADGQGKRNSHLLTTFY